MCIWYDSYKKHHVDFFQKIKDFDELDLAEADNMFPKMILDKAYAYGISNSDILIYTLVSVINAFPMIENYIKVPKNNKVLLDKFMSNSDSLNRKLAEVFELKIADNKYVNKKTKSKFTYEELNTIKNKHMMGMELLHIYLDNDFFNLFEKTMKHISENNVSGATIGYLLSYLCFNEENRKQIVSSMKEKSEFFLQKVRFKIEQLYDFSAGVLRLSVKNRYETFVDEELIKMTDYVKKEKEQIIDAFTSDEHKYLEMIESLTKRLNQLEKENAELKNNTMGKYSPLKNKNVLVVGDTSRKESYKKIIEQYGGCFDFMDGIFEPEKISHMSEKADVAILIIPRIKHSVSFALKTKKIPTIFVNNAGVSSFQEVLDEYCCG